MNQIIRHHFSLFVISWVILAFALPYSAHADDIIKQDCVVTLHGIARGPSAMKSTVKRLQTAGYSVANVGYASLKKPLEQLAVDIHKGIPETCKNAPKMHFAVHSMGGLLARAYIKKYTPKNLGRVVTMGTPHHGSEVADFLKEVWPYRWFFGPAGQQLVTDQSGIEKLFGPIDFELGSIAGNQSIDPFSSYLLPGKDDGRVSIASTKIEGMTDHVIVPAIHVIMPDYTIVQDQALYFLKHGKFNHASQE